MKTMWAVSCGEYSDYRVLCICDSKKHAKAAVKALGEKNGDNAFIERINYLDRDPRRVEIHFRSLEIYDIGTTGQYVERVRSTWDFDEDAEDLVPAKWRWVRAPYIATRGGRLEVSGLDGERVAQIFSDRRAMILSEPALRAQKEATGTARRVKV